MELEHNKHRPIDLLRYAGLFAWLCATVPLFLKPLWSPHPMDPERYIAWWVLHLVFGFTWWNQVQSLPVLTSLAHRLLTVTVLTVSAVGVSLTSGTALGGILLLILAGLLPWILSFTPALAWLVGQNAALAAALSRVPEIELADALLLGGLFLGISLFAFMTGIVALQQHAARDELRKVNSELRATQALLADNTRIAERVRIARELHDLVGHHLTALTLNLEVATHLVEGRALQHVEQARSLAKLLLADVREVVSEMREGDKVDLASALRTLAGGTPEPRIHLDLPEELAQTDPQRAQVLLRCAQEMITNAVRHAQARNLWIGLVKEDGGVALTARDDGRGSQSFERGNGLSGMRERLQAVGGDLEIRTRPGAGFALRAWMPTEDLS